jgi:peptide/nickel transport system substrate-binding protein
VAGSEDLQVLRFQSGEADLISRVSARNFAVLEKDRERRGYELVDAGPGLEYSFLFFNLNDAPPGASEALAARLAVFRRPKFRQAVSLAIDRDALVKLVYGGRATPIGVPVPAGDRQWTDANLPRPKRSIDQARRTLASDGFTWAADGALIDPSGKKVEFSIATSAGNTDRVQMATLIQDDLKPLGIAAHAAPLEFASLLNRVTTTRDFEGCLLSLSNPDADPNPGMAFWLSSSGNHLWRPEQKSPATAWEAEIDSLMRRQMTERNPAARKRLFDRVQEIAIEQMPVVPLVTPHILAGARAHVRNFRPANMEHYVLWNVETLYLKEK